MQTEEMNNFENLIKKDKYQVFVFCCPAYFPTNFAKHAWIVVNKKGEISRWEIRHYRNNKTTNFLHINTQSPFNGIQITFGLKRFWSAKLLGSLEGCEEPRIQQTIEFIENSQKKYPYCNKYKLLGPNSNTYVQNVLNNFPEFNIKLGWRFVGKSYKVKE
jgi:hypothetical protein